MKTYPAAPPGGNVIVLLPSPLHPSPGICARSAGVDDVCNLQPWGKPLPHNH